jgi:hypothetical protein
MARKEKSKNGVVARSGGRELFCTRCGAVREIALPVALTDWTRFAGEFTKQHADCKPKPKR